MPYKCKCEECGKIFMAKSKIKKTCSEVCRKERKRRYDDQWREHIMKQKKSYNKQVYGMSAEDLKRIRDKFGLNRTYNEPPFPLSFMVDQSRQYGLTYGMYMAYRQRGMIT